MQIIQKVNDSFLMISHSLKLNVKEFITIFTIEIIPTLIPIAQL